MSGVVLRRFKPCLGLPHFERFDLMMPTGWKGPHMKDAKSQGKPVSTWKSVFFRKASGTGGGLRVAVWHRGGRCKHAH